MDIKFKVGDLEEVRGRLQGLGSKVSSRRQSDMYMVAPNGQRVRMRLDPSTPVATAVAKLPSETIQVEVPGGSIPALARLLAAVGCEDAKLVAKDREEWAIGSVQVRLDSVDDLGQYVEISGPDFRVEMVIRSLGFDLNQAIQGSYYDLMTRFNEAAIKAVTAAS